jgi:hypothetical protein
MQFTTIRTILAKINPLNLFKKKLPSWLNWDELMAKLTLVLSRVDYTILTNKIIATLPKLLPFIKGLKKLNTEEIIIGFIFGLTFVGVIGWWAVLMAFVTSLFWALTGAGYSKLFRRVGVPLVACLAVALVKQYYLVFISLPLAFAVLSIGYGIPSPNDAGSPLGQFFYALNPDNANILTRGTIYLLLALAFFPLLLLVL